MPGAAILRIDRLWRATASFDRRLGAATGEPVRVRQDDDRLGIVGRLGDDVLVERNDYFRHLAIGLREPP